MNVVPPASGPVEPADHVGCIMAIVGSRHFPGIYNWNLRAEQIITSVLFEHRPVLVISGGAVGIDTLAVDIAKRLGYQAEHIKPKVFTWEGEGGLKERNSQLAAGCQCLVRIFDPASATYGSGWTADQAQQLGKRVERYAITDLPYGEIQAERDRRVAARMDRGWNPSTFDPNK